MLFQLNLHLWCVYLTFLFSYLNLSVNTTTAVYSVCTTDTSSHLHSAKFISDKKLAGSWKRDKGKYYMGDLRAKGDILVPLGV